MIWQPTVIPQAPAILQNLASAPGISEAPAVAESNQTPPTENLAEPPADPEVKVVQELTAKGLRGPLVALKAVRAGVVPGVSVPQDAPQIPSSLRPEDLVELGVGFYLPRADRQVRAVIYNPLRVSSPELEYLDARRMLAQVFPPITRWLKPVAGDEQRLLSNQALPSEGTPSSGEVVQFAQQVAAPLPQGRRAEGTSSPLPLGTQKLPPIVNAPKRSRLQL